MVKQRVITALVLALVFAACLFVLPPAGFNTFTLVAFSIAAWEWARLCGFEARPARVAYAAASVGVVALLLWYALDSQWGIIESRFRMILMVACAWWALALLWVQTYPSSALLWKSPWVRAIIGLLVLAPAWCGLVYLKALANGGGWIALVVLVVAAADIGAFFVGRKWGRHKLAAQVSPGKTWEGFFGGLAANVVVALVLAVILKQGVSGLGTLLLIVLATSLASALGDLLESMVKRHQGVKDSGNILPGHGGVLDRIDGLTAALPVFSLLLLLTGWRG